MPVSRMRMRPWLEDKINSNTITGLVWVDKERKMFSIPWKHAARHGWVMDKDACLFKQWAVHTGKFRDGETKPDAKTWKANFRCAMNSLPDIQEVKDKSVNKGNQAVRVYKMLHIPSKPHNKKSKAKDTKKNNKRSMIKTEEVNYSDSQCAESHTQEDSTTQESTVDSTEDLGLSESTYVNDSDVPDWSTSVEIGPDSTNNIYASFQVSPDHSPDYDLDTEAIIEITQQLEQDTTQWMQNGMNSKGFLSNEVGTAESYLSSPESQWSNNSGEELELTLYTELSSRPAEDIFSYDYWNPSVPASYNHQQIPLFSI